MFNIRVYGILINENREILLADERIRGNDYTKFPGGGLEPGEGTRDCLKRELREELNIEVETGEHIYTTDYFQPSAFHAGQQVISIYYYATAVEPLIFPLRGVPFDFNEQELAMYEKTGETETFRFVNLDKFSEESVTLPIDKIVARMIKERH